MESGGRKYDMVVYVCQIAIIFIVVITSLLNISLSDQNMELWISLLGSAFGCILPSPKLRKIKSEPKEGPSELGEST